MSSRFVMRVDDEQGAIIKEVTRQFGATLGDALRMFPYEICLNRKIEIEPFDSEEEATAFATSLSTGLTETN